MGKEITIARGGIVRGLLNKPEKECKGVIVIIHGLGEHFGRYTGWSERFLTEGYAVAGIDLPGHGTSDGRRGHIRSYDQIDNVLDGLIEVVSSEIPGIPLIIYGHSLGGGIVLQYLIKRQPAVACAVVTSPWLMLSFQPPKLKLLLATLVRRVLPRLVQPSGLIVNYLSRRQEVVKAYTSDPLVHDRISVSLFYAAVSAASFALKNAAGINVPLLLMHGSNDLITSPEGSRKFAAMSAKTTIKIWEGAYHELHNDIIDEEVFRFIREWLEGQKYNLK